MFFYKVAKKDDGLVDEFFSRKGAKALRRMMIWLMKMFSRKDAKTQSFVGDGCFSRKDAKACFSLCALTSQREAFFTLQYR